MSLVTICCCTSLLLARVPAIPSAGTRLSVWLGCSLALSGVRWLLGLANIMLSGGQGCVLSWLCTQQICTSDTETDGQTDRHRHEQGSKNVCLHMHVHSVSYTQTGTQKIAQIDKGVWAARYNTWLLIKLTPKGVVFSFLF